MEDNLKSFLRKEILKELSTETISLQELTKRLQEKYKELDLYVRDIRELTQPMLSVGRISYAPGLLLKIPKENETTKY